MRHGKQLYRDAVPKKWFVAKYSKKYPPGKIVYINKKDSAFNNRKGIILITRRRVRLDVGHIDYYTSVYFPEQEKVRIFATSHLLDEVDFFLRNTLVETDSNLTLLLHRLYYGLRTWEELPKEDQATILAAGERFSEIQKLLVALNVITEKEKGD